MSNNPTDSRHIEDVRVSCEETRFEMELQRLFARETTAVIPAFNEERTIGAVVRETRRYVDEVIVIDDGSSDRTRDLALAEGALVLSHPRNLGYGSALASGFRYVKGNGAKVMVVLDGDGQHDPSDIPKLVAPIADGRADITSGSRFIDSGSKLSIPIYRRMGISIVNRTWAVAMGKSVTDTQCGYRAYSKRAICSIDLKESNMSASLEILNEARQKGLRVVEVPVTVSYNGKTSTIWPGRHGAELINYVLRMMKEEGCLTVAGMTANCFRQFLWRVRQKTP